VPRKGLETLIEAVARLTREGIEVKCRLAGTGPLRQRLWQDIRSRGLESTVLLVGDLHGSDLQSFYTSLDLYVLPSEDEGMPVSVLEAMAAELPVVSTAVGAVPDMVVDGATGYLLAPGDGAGLAAAIRHLALHPEEATRMGHAGRQRFLQHFSEQAGWPGLERAYRALIGCPAPSPSGAPPELGRGKDGLAAVCDWPEIPARRANGEPDGSV
jgi:glycosyltransferase involved in cell wall biosynthesis